MIYLLQLAFLVFGWFSAAEEAAFTHPFRTVDFAGKDALTRTFHRAGAGAVCAMLIFAGAAGWAQAVEFWPQVAHFFLYFVLAGLWYWNTFDLRYARLIGQAWHYLGTSADTDRWLRRRLGPHAGKIKTAVSVFFVILLNLVYVLLLHPDL